MPVLVGAPQAFAAHFDGTGPVFGVDHGNAGRADGEVVDVGARRAEPTAVVQDPPTPIFQRLQSR